MVINNNVGNFKGFFSDASVSLFCCPPSIRVDTIRTLDFFLVKNDNKTFFRLEKKRKNSLPF
jgi:hypothetical protein